jgi:hypothetical protein
MSEKRAHFAPREAPGTVYGFPPEGFDPSILPDVDREFLDPADIEAFERALHAPDPLQSPVDEARSPKSPSFSFGVTKRNSESVVDDEASTVAAAAAAAGGDLHAPPSPTLEHGGQGTFITAQNDWAPVTPKHYHNKRGSKRRHKRAKDAVEGILGTRTRDETREGYLYQLVKWPLLGSIFLYLGWLGVAYLLTRLYIWVYEHFFTWRGQRERLRKNLRSAANYRDWVAAARELDHYLGRGAWKEENSFAYYDYKTVRRVWDQLRKTRAKAEAQEDERKPSDGGKAVEDLKALLEACVKNNFVGIENARLYSQTYYGTKNLVQNFVDESKYLRSRAMNEMS